jgi:hypothetical protein
VNAATTGGTKNSPTPGRPSSVCSRARRLMRSSLTGLPAASACNHRLHRFWLTSFSRRTPPTRPCPAPARS